MVVGDFDMTERRNKYVKLCHNQAPLEKPETTRYSHVSVSVMVQKFGGVIRAHWEHSESCIDSTRPGGFINDIIYTLETTVLNSSCVFAPVSDWHQVIYTRYGIFSGPRDSIVKSIHVAPMVEPSMDTTRSWFLGFEYHLSRRVV